MTTVSVVTAQPGPPDRIERVYLDGDHAYRFTGDYNGPNGPSGGRRCRSASVALSCGTPATATDAMTSTSANKAGRDALPEPR